PGTAHRTTERPHPSPSAHSARRDRISAPAPRARERRGDTLYAVLYPRRSTRARVVHFPRTERLDVWCRRSGVEEAVVGGFFLRDPYRPLGELWIDGRQVPHEPVAAPYAERRGDVGIDGGPAKPREG